MTEYVLTATARRDLDDIIDFLLRRESVERALHVYDRFEETFRRLAASPGIGFQREHLWPGKRVASVFDWLAVYDPDTQPLAIIRVIYGPRNLDAIFNACDVDD